MSKNDKTAKRLYKRIEVLEDRYDNLVQTLSAIVEKQDFKLEEIEEYLEIGE